MSTDHRNTRPDWAETRLKLLQADCPVRASRWRKMRPAVFTTLIITMLALWLFAFAPRARADTVGMASYYGTESGTRTASGQRFRPHGFTAAHRRLPFGTCLKVQLIATGRSVNVTVNDRGPFVRGRIIDLSVGAARAIGLTHRGVGRVRLSRCP